MLRLQYASRLSSITHNIVDTVRSCLLWGCIILKSYFRSNPGYRTVARLNILKSQYLRRGLFNLARNWYIVWRRGSRYTTNVEVHKVTGSKVIVSQGAVISSNNATSQERIGWPMSNLVKIMPVRSVTCDTRKVQATCH